MKNKARLFSIILAFILLIVVAVTAGIGLAIWDTGSTVAEVYAMTFPVKADIVGETQTVEVSGDSIADISEPAPAGNYSEIRKETPKVSEISDAFEQNTYEESGKTVKSLTSEGGIKSLVSGDTASSSKSDNKANQNDGDKKSDSIEDKEPLQITAEISGVKTVVRAGREEDMLENTIQTPAGSNGSSNANIDPLADYPLPFTEVDLSYFDDALFIGDSRVAGLAMNSGTNATFNAVTSFQVYKYKTFKVVQTPNGKVPIFDAMPYDKYTKIYIKVGLNELGSVTDEPFLNAYTSLINDLRVMQPRAIIYIQAILPVTQVKSQTDRVHCNENIAKRNENLKSFAELMKCYYVDVGPYFADETGALRPETTADGIHMYGKYMPQWIDALRKQAVIWPPEQ